MPFDAELTQLTRETRNTFGMAAWEAARDRALVFTRMAAPDEYWSDEPTSFETWPVFYAALKTELRRLLQPQ